MKKPAPTPAASLDLVSQSQAPAPSLGRLIPCPGLVLDVRRGTVWTDSAGAEHNLDNPAHPTLTAGEAAADPRLRRLGITTDDEVHALRRSGALYPVWQKNARVFAIFDLALTDYARRALTARRAA
jgi:hypothetical protein